MFVSYDPYNCFDVYRPQDRCVCGCSSRFTSSSGEDKGYCVKCAEDREHFVEDVVGNIKITDNPFQNVFSLLEASRRTFLKIKCII